MSAPFQRPLSPAARHSSLGHGNLKASATAGDPPTLQDVAHPTPKLYVVQPAAHDPPITQFKTSDPVTEAAIVAFIGTEQWLAIEHVPLKSQDFSVEHWGIIYQAARAIWSKKTVCISSINEWIEENCAREFQRSLGGSTVDWRNWWSEAQKEAGVGSSLSNILDGCERIARYARNREEHALRQGVGDGSIGWKEAFARIEKLQGANGEFFAQFDARRFNPSQLHEKPEPIFLLKDQPIATPGNIVALYAQAKAGKSAVISALIAAVITDDEHGDFLGFQSAANPEGKAIIHLDTEQSRYDHEQVVMRALRRAEREQIPLWLRSYCLTDLDIATRRSFISKELERANKEHQGVFCVLVDGIGDFVPDVNDITSTHEFIVELHGLAIKFNTVLILVLHENPGTGKLSIEKMRGHLGSQLERKAESNIRILKEKDGTCLVYTEKSRHANIPREHAHKFAWSDAQSTHATIEGSNSTSDNTAERHFVEAIFDTPDALGGFSYSALHERIRELGGYKPGSERHRFTKLLKLNLIERNNQGFYRATL